MIKAAAHILGHSVILAGHGLAFMDIIKSHTVLEFLCLVGHSLLFAVLIVTIKSKSPNQDRNETG